MLISRFSFFVAWSNELFAVSVKFCLAMNFVFYVVSRVTGWALKYLQKVEVLDLRPIKPLKRTLYPNLFVPGIFKKSKLSRSCHIYRVNACNGFQ